MRDRPNLELRSPTCLVTIYTTQLDPPPSSSLTTYRLHPKEHVHKFYIHQEDHCIISERSSTYQRTLWSCPFGIRRVSLEMSFPVKIRRQRACWPLIKCSPYLLQQGLSAQGTPSSLRCQDAILARRYCSRPRNKLNSNQHNSFNCEKGYGPHGLTCSLSALLITVSPYQFGPLACWWPRPARCWPARRRVTLKGDPGLSYKTLFFKQMLG